MSDRPASTRHFRRLTAVAGAVALFVLLCSATALPASEQRQSPIVKAIRRASPAIVNIRGEKTVANLPQAGQASEGNRRVNGMGTGVIVDSRGYIVTNHHVVDGVREIQVTLSNEDKYTARLIARDLSTDLAVIKIDAGETLPVITVGTSSDLMAGESVIAVGNAYGYENTVTRGIISALHRAVQVSDAQFYDDLIQTDASINPGNSGGPLLNIDGEMIGINVAVRAGAQGIGFAIPVDRVMSVAGELFASAGAKSAWHGMTVAAGKNGISGVKVTSVERNSPAAEAGVQSGDAVLAVGDEKVERPLDFHRLMLDRQAGDELKLTLERKESGSRKESAVKLVLGGAAKEIKTPASAAWELLGLELKSIGQDDFRQMFQTRYRGGLTVTAVRPGSPADAQGIRRGDVLVGMHIWETISLDNVSYILNRSDFATINPLKFFILRGNETLYGYIAVAMKKDAVQ